MKKFRVFIKEVRDLQVGQRVKVGFPGSRIKHFGQISHLTPTQVHAHDKVFDRETMLQKGVSKRPAYGKVPTLHVATQQELDAEYRKSLLDMIQSTKWHEMPTEKLESVLDTHTNWSYDHIKKFHQQ